MRHVAALALLCAVDWSQAHAQTLEQQERLNQLEKTMGAIDNLMAATERLAKAKKLECVTAIANEALCECLTQNLPVTVSFVNYVAIVTQTKEDLEYNKLSAEDKKIVDNTRSSRDKCVRGRR